MKLKIGKNEHDSDRVPILLYWKTQAEKKAFVLELIAINNFSRFTKLVSFSSIKIEDIVYAVDTEVHIKFNCREEKSSILRELYELGSDCNMFIDCPGDIPHNVLSDWIYKSLSDFGLDTKTAIATN